MVLSMMLKTHFCKMVIATLRPPANKCNVDILLVVAQHRCNHNIAHEC
jgi:hypothetical protein